MIIISSEIELHDFFKFITGQRLVIDLFHACLQAVAFVLLHCEGGQGYDVCLQDSVSLELHYPLGGVYSIHDWHSDVHDDQLWNLVLAPTLLGKGLVEFPDCYLSVWGCINLNRVIV